MKIKLNDVLTSKDGQTSIQAGKVVAIGESAVIVRVTEETSGGLGTPVKEGSLYEVREGWFQGEHAFYEVKGDFFKVGETYRYTKGWSAAAHPGLRFKVIELVHLDDPEDGSHDVAITIGTNDEGHQWVETFVQVEFNDMGAV